MLCALLRSYTEFGRGGSALDALVLFNYHIELELLSSSEKYPSESELVREEALAHALEQ